MQGGKKNDLCLRTRTTTIKLFEHVCPSNLFWLCSIRICFSHKKGGEKASLAQIRNSNVYVLGTVPTTQTKDMVKRTGYTVYGVGAHIVSQTNGVFPLIPIYSGCITKDK